MRRPFVAVAAAMLFSSTAFAQCVTTPIACGDVLHGALTASDCKSAEGAPEDSLVFSGSVGQYVRAVLYASPWRADLALMPPMAGVPSPRVAGGMGCGAAAYVLPLSGTWRLAIGGRDLPPTADYVVALSCHATTFGDRPDCLEQSLLCGQTAEWTLTSKSCDYNDSPGRFYAEYLFLGKAGEIFAADAESADFPPRIAVYDAAKLGDPIAASNSVTNTVDSIIYVLPYTGLYQVFVTSRRVSAVRVGRFKLTVRDCPSPGCLPPVIAEQPADVAVPYGARAMLSATALGLGPLRYTWSDRTYLPTPPFVVSQRFTTPPMTARTSFAVTVDAPCDSVDSRVVTVTPRDGRPRAARR
jgi:hypothetical protein